MTVATLDSDGIKQQMRAIYGHPSKQFSTQVVRVQQQQGTTDCGLYAIAYAVHVANGDDTAKSSLNRGKCEQHFLECMKKKLEAFPVEKTISRVAIKICYYLTRTLYTYDIMLTSPAMCPRMYTHSLFHPCITIGRI